MRTKFLIAGLLCLVSATTFAQKKELENAQESYDTYVKLIGAAGTGSLSTTSILAAQTSIDKAATNPKTSGLAQTYALKAAIYSALSLRDTVQATTLPLFTTADDAVKKAVELDIKGENKVIIGDAHAHLAQYKENEGVNEFRAQKYDLAYHSFDYYRQTYPNDTTAVYYTGISAAQAENYTAALTNYNKLITLTYSKNPIVYLDIASINLLQKDTTAGLKAVGDGIQKYPLSSELRKLEIEISLQSGRQQEMLGKIQSAIANDPKNKVLLYYGGVTYEQFGEAQDDQLRKTKDPVAKSALQAKKNDNFSKAADMYRKALDIDPNYFDANLHLGYVISNPAIDLFNAANQLPVSKQKEYDADIAKANAQFEIAKPYLLKAVNMEPQNLDALENLKTYYLGTGKMADATAIKKRIDALPGVKTDAAPATKKQ